MQETIKDFFNKIEVIIASKLPFVVYRKPNENEVSVIVQRTSKLTVLKNYNLEGFVFAPFKKMEEKIFFPMSESEITSILIKDFKDLNIEVEKPEIKEVANIKADNDKHLQLVENSINFIKNNKAEKIVVSRKENIQLLNFNALNSFKKMLKNYENAMVYFWFHPEVGSWMGASPERLIHINNRKFKTMALAGTQSYINDIDVPWKSKEKQEQQFVTDYILDTIKMNVSNVEVSKPYTVKAGNLLHIRTDILGDLKEDDSLGNLINSLHPTPAVCGLPKKVATDFILKNEGYNRSYYSGFLGELNMRNNTNLYVNLRCMQVFNESISIFVGGGITKDSVAKKEWDETVFKAEVMRKIL